MIKTLKKFFAFCQEKYRKEFYLSIVCGTVQAIFETYKILAIAIVINGLIQKNVTVKTALTSLIIMLISIIGAGIVKNKSTLLQTDAGYGMCAEKRMELARHFRYLPMGYYNANSIGEVMSVITNTMQNLENVASTVVMMVCGGLLNTAVMTIMIFAIDWRIGLILTAGLVLFFFVNNAMINISSKISDEKLQKDTNLVSKVIEYIQGITEVKTYGLTGSKSKDFNKAVDETEKANADMELSLIPFTTAQDFILKIVGTAISFISVLFFINGSMSLLYCIMMIISSYIIYSSLESAGRSSSLLRVVDVSVDHEQNILNIKAMDIDGKDVIPNNHTVKADNIEFSYGGKQIINGISLEIPEKTSAAIVGTSGSGKTTLTQLLARFWDTDKGKVTLGGTDIKNYSIDSLMKNYSFVFQNVYLFHDTIANNIRFGEPDVSMDKVVSAAKKACCHDFISALPDGYNTVIGEGGASLSGGEKQRISIARAIMKDAPIIILDEATANVDPENEAELMSAINELTKEKTVIMIAHRLKTVRNANQIFVIDKGKIAQKGTHEELISQNGIYKRFIQEREKAVSWRI